MSIAKKMDKNHKRKNKEQTGEKEAKPTEMKKFRVLILKIVTEAVCLTRRSKFRRRVSI